MLLLRGGTDGLMNRLHLRTGPLAPPQLAARGTIRPCFLNQLCCSLRLMVSSCGTASGLYIVPGAKQFKPTLSCTLLGWFSSLLGATP